VLSPGLLTTWTRQTVAAARAGDEDQVAATVRRIAEAGDALDLLAFCRAVADAAPCHGAVTALVAAAAGASPGARGGSLRSLITYAAELEARAAHTEGTEG
jgi:hypothetical protein